MLEQWIEGFTYAGRGLKRSPVFTIAAVLTVGLGVGASTAMFSLANWTLLRPVPGVRNAGELLFVVPRPIGNRATGVAPLSDPVIRRLEAGGPAISSLAAYSGLDADVLLVDGGEPLRVTAQVVTPGFFRTLGVPPWRGRDFDAAEADPASVHAVVVVSHDFWRDHLASDPDAVGRTLDVNGNTFSVVGVAPPPFRGPNRTDAVSLWFPSSAMPVVMARVPSNILTMEGAPLWSSVIVRRDSDATADAVSDQLTVLAPELAQRDVVLEVTEGFGVHPTLRAHLHDTLALVAGLVGLLLVLTVANLVNLVVTRVLRRQREVVIRKALGASWTHVTAALAAEGVVLALLGSMAAVLVGFGLIAVIDGATLMEWMPAIQSVPLDGRVMGFTLGTALVVTGTTSLLAATGIQRLAPTDVLRGGGAGVAPGGVLRRSMVAVQVGLALALVVGAGLLVQSVARLQGDDLGLSAESVVVFSLNPGLQGYSDEDADRLFRELRSELAADPSIDEVAFTWLMPFGPRRYTERVRRPDMPSDEDAVVVLANMVTPSFFDAMGIPVVDGRSFDGREYGRADRPDRGAVVVNRTLAEWLFPDGGAVGQDIVMPGRRETAFEVVGVVEDARLTDPRDVAGPMLFDPFGNGYKTTSATFVATVTGNADVGLNRMREIVRARDARLPLLEAGVLGEVVRKRLSEDRALARITASFALLSLLLAASGLFALISELALSRLREFGIRSALGASAARVMVIVLRDSFAVVGTGTLLGVPLALGVGALLGSRLVGVGSADLSTFGVATVVLFVVATLASLPVAVRAGRIDPARVLMAE